MEDKHEVTVPMPGELHDEIVDNLEYGDSKAGWIREAIRLRLEHEGNGSRNDAETNGGSQSRIPAHN